MNKDKIGKLRWLAQRALYCGSNRTKHYFEIQNHQIFFYCSTFGYKEGSNPLVLSAEKSLDDAYFLKKRLTLM